MYWWVLRWVTEARTINAATKSISWAKFETFLMKRTQQEGAENNEKMVKARSKLK
jgi:hypothetical protein